MRRGLLLSLAHDLAGSHFWRNAPEERERTTTGRQDGIPEAVASPLLLRGSANPNRFARH